MINIKILQIYNNKPYYAIRKNKGDYRALGAEQAIKVIKDIRKNKERIKVEDISDILEEHNKLLKTLK